MTISISIWTNFRFCAHRNFGLLSFGEEAEEDETETNDFVQKNATKSKSVHDAVDDPKLSKETITIPKSKNRGDNADGDDGNGEENTIESGDESALKVKTDRIRDKLKKSAKSSDETAKTSKTSASKLQTELNERSDSDSDEFTNELERERKRKRQMKA